MVFLPLIFVKHSHEEAPQGQWPHPLMHTHRHILIFFKFFLFLKNWRTLKIRFFEQAHFPVLQNETVSATLSLPGRELLQLRY